MNDSLSQRIVSTQTGTATGIALDSGFVYWSIDEGLVSRCPLAGCAGAATTILMGASVWGIAVDATNVYLDDSTNGIIGSCPLAGCPGAAAMLAHVKPNTTAALALHGGWLYWLVTIANLPNGVLSGCDVTNCAATVTDLVTGLLNAGGLAADASGVYWGEGGVLANQGRVGRVGLHGGPATLIASGNAAGAVVLDSTSVYFAYGGTVAKCAKSGCNGTPVILARSTITSLGSLAVDNTSIYWSEPASPGAIKKAPK